MAAKEHSAVDGHDIDTERSQWRLYIVRMSALGPSAYALCGYVHE